MDQLPCRYCQDLHETVQISSPSILEDLLIRAAKKVHLGSLKELTVFQEPVHPNSPSQFHDTLSDMVVRKSLFNWKVQGWGDIVDLTFQCTHCGATFLLHAETYHGSGGAWEATTTEKS